MNRFGKLLLVVSSLAPVLGAFAVNALSRQQYATATWCAGIGVGLVALCLLLIHACRSQLSREPLKVAKVKSVDKETLAFLLVYLLPLLAKDMVSFKGDILTAIYVFIIIGLAVYHSNAFTFNPILALRGYHFYEVESTTGMTYLLMTRQTVRTQKSEFTVIGLSNYIYMDVE